MKLHLGENIRENRCRMGLTQEQLADRLGVSFQSVSRWEKGTTYPDMEKLPEIARMFDITTDTLLGYGGNEGKKPYSEVVAMLETALGECDEDEICRLLRVIRHDYRDEFLHGDDCVERMSPVLIITYTDVLRKPAVLAELREFAGDFFKFGTDMLFRSHLIIRMAELEDEEHIDDFIEKYSSDVFDLTRSGLLVERYRSLEMWDKYNEYRMYADYERLRYFLEGQSPDEEPGDPAHLVRISEAKLGMLRALNEAEPDDRFPVSDDGEVDVWCGMRYYIALDYAAQLSGCGEYERALTVLEDMRGMIDKLTAIPDGAVIPCRSPQFSGLTLVKSTFAGLEWFETPHGEGEQPYENVRLMSMISIGNVPYLSLTSWKDKYTDARWFDPMRDDPRFCEILRWAEGYRISEE